MPYKCERCGMQVERLFQLEDASDSIQYTELTGVTYIDVDHLCFTCLCQELGVTDTDLINEIKKKSKFEVKKELPLEVRKFASYLFAREKGFSGPEITEYFSQYSDMIINYWKMESPPSRWKIFEDCLEQFDKEKQIQILLDICNYEGPFKHGRPSIKEINKLRRLLVELKDNREQDIKYQIVFDLVKDGDFRNESVIEMHISKAIEYYSVDGKEDDCIGQLRKAYEQILIDVTDRISDSKKTKIQCKQSKPNIKERIEFLRANGFYTEELAKYSYQVYKTLCEHGGHPGIATSREKEIKYNIATRMIKDLLEYNSSLENL